MKINEPKKNEKCFSCNHLGFCQVYWGIDCKRQGGYRTPRLKSQGKMALVKKEANNIQKVRRERNKMEPKMVISQPIKTKRAIWA